MVVERIGQSGVFSSCSNLREHSVKTTPQMTRFRDVQQAIIMATV